MTAIDNDLLTYTGWSLCVNGWIFVGPEQHNWCQHRCLHKTCESSSMTGYSDGCERNPYLEQSVGTNNDYLFNKSSIINLSSVLIELIPRSSSRRTNNHSTEFLNPLINPTCSPKIKFSKISCLSAPFLPFASTPPWWSPNVTPLQQHKTPLDL